jgi:hypothetical protein
VAYTRDCEQCGRLFVPPREHSRFCSARCRLAWNRQNAGDRQIWDCALGWSTAAMREATGRLATTGAAELRQGLALVSDAVWALTIVDATLVRYHPRQYDGALAIKGPAGRRLIEATFAGLRFVRNRMGYHEDPADFVDAVGHAGSRESAVTAWMWRHLPEPALGSLPPHGRSWELSRYRAYQDQLAGRPVGDSLALAAEFLTLATDAAQPLSAGC